jgi:hypothetical protein
VIFYETDSTLDVFWMFKQDLKITRLGDRAFPGWRAMLGAGRGAQGLEGSRFGSCPEDLVIFFLMRGRPNAVLNRRLPQITERDVLSHRAARGFFIRSIRR